MTATGLADERDRGPVRRHFVLRHYRLAILAAAVAVTTVVVPPLVVSNRRPAAPARATGAPTPLVDPSAPRVPDALVGLIVTAGHRCPEVSPARMAALFSVVTEFDASAVDPDGAQGIAMFSENTWKLYRPSPDASRLDPGAAIPAAAHLICDLLNQTRDAGLPGDPWPNAIAAYMVGVPTLVASNGTLPVGSLAADNVKAITGRVPTYEADPRLRS